MKEEHGWFYKLINLILGRFGLHLAKNPPCGRKVNKEKTECLRESIQEDQK